MSRAASISKPIDAPIAHTGRWRREVGRVSYRRGRSAEAQVAKRFDCKRLGNRGISTNDVENDTYSIEVKCRTFFPAMIPRPLIANNDTIGCAGEQYIIMLCSDFFLLRNQGKIEAVGGRLVIRDKWTFRRLFINADLAKYSGADDKKYRWWVYVMLKSAKEKRSKKDQLTMLFLHRHKNKFKDDIVCFLIEDVRIDRELGGITVTSPQSGRTFKGLEILPEWLKWEEVNGRDDND